MIESTGNYNYGPDDYKDHFDGFKAQPAQLLPLAEAETYVSIPLSEYARYIKREPIADRMAQLIAEEWVKDAENGWLSNQVQEERICLKFYDPELYRATEERVEAIQASKRGGEK